MTQQQNKNAVTTTELDFHTPLKNKQRKTSKPSTQVCQPSNAWNPPNTEHVFQSACFPQEPADVWKDY